MSSFLERWRQYNKDVYRFGYESGRRNPDQSLLASLREYWKSDVLKDYISDERFRESDPWHRGVNHRRMLAFSLQLSGWLAAVAEGLLKVVEWTLVIALFKFLASQTAHPAFDAIATALYVALVLYLLRHFIPFVMFEARTKSLPSILIATAVSVVALIGAVLSFTAIGQLVEIVAVNQSIL